MCFSISLLFVLCVSVVVSQDAGNVPVEVKNILHEAGHTPEDVATAVNAAQNMINNIFRADDPPADGEDSSYWGGIDDEDTESESHSYSPYSGPNNEHSGDDDSDDDESDSVSDDDLFGWGDSDDEFIFHRFQWWYALIPLFGLLLLALGISCCLYRMCSSRKPVHHHYHGRPAPQPLVPAGYVIATTTPTVAVIGTPIGTARSLGGSTIVQSTDPVAYETFGYNQHSEIPNRDDATYHDNDNTYTYF